MENAVLRLYLERFKTLNQQELGRLIDNSDEESNYYYKVGFCKGQLDLIKLIEQLLEESEDVKH